MIKIAEMAHQLLLERTKDRFLAIDMTAGRGWDTLFLASHFEQVIAFDIQNEAILSTQTLLLENHRTNVVLYQEDHSQFDFHLLGAIDAVIYNLGYLPKGDKSIRTEAPTTIASLEHILPCLKTTGCVVLTLYPKENEREANEVLRFCQKLKSAEYDVIKWSVVNKELAPYLLQIIKIKKEGS